MAHTFNLALNRHTDIIVYISRSDLRWSENPAKCVEQYLSSACHQFRLLGIRGKRAYLKVQTKSFDLLCRSSRNSIGRRSYDTKRAGDHVSKIVAKHFTIGIILFAIERNTKELSEFQCKNA